MTFITLMLVRVKSEGSFVVGFEDLVLVFFDGSRESSDIIIKNTVDLNSKNSFFTITINKWLRVQTKSGLKDL